MTALAERLHVTRLAASNLLNGNAGLSAEMAIRFENVFGLKADTLIRMQSAHALAEARAREEWIVVEWSGVEWSGVGHARRRGIRKRRNAAPISLLTLEFPIEPDQQGAA